MRKHSPSNERIKRDYFLFLKEAKRQDESSVDAVAAAVARFEAYTRHRDFKTFHYRQAVAFKQWLAQQCNAVTGKPLSKATLHATLSQLKRFFQWLAGQPGYRSRFSYSDADYFNVSEKDARVATARRSRPAPTMDQIRHVIGHMPAGTEIERRDRAVLAFTLLTGARDSAVASAKLKHLDMASGCFYQDARDVNTKFSKTFTTYFFPVGSEAKGIVESWVRHLREERMWGGEDPLFPATNVAVGIQLQFEAVGLKREHWRGAAPIRRIFREAFGAAGLPYFHPHSFRSTLAQLGESLCQSPEEFKAWSQNLGHDGVLTTFYSYGAVAVPRQGEIIRSLGAVTCSNSPDVDRLAKAVAREIMGALPVGGR